MLGFQLLERSQEGLLILCPGALVSKSNLMR